jgi:hypothetical protein
VTHPGAQEQQNHPPPHGGVIGDHVANQRHATQGEAQNLGSILHNGQGARHIFTNCQPSLGCICI